MNEGKLTVIVGSMFSGKSTELLRQGRRHELAGRRVLYVKPKMDVRYSASEVVSHDVDRRAAVAVACYDELLGVINGQPEAVQVVLIDEVQFFGPSLVVAINQLLDRGTDVICSGLDLDRNARPFGIVPDLMALADEVLKLKAVCAECGADAWVSYGEFDDSRQVVLGAADRYKPLCRRCFRDKQRKGA